MAHRLATAVDIALFELNANLLDGVQDRLLNTKQISSAHATICIGHWLGQSVAIISPKEIQSWEDFVESVQLTHKTNMMLGVDITDKSPVNSLEAEAKLGRLYSMCDPEDFSDLRIKNVLNHFPQHDHKHENLLFPVLGSLVPDAGLYKRRTIARRLGGLAGKLLRQPKELLKIPDSISKRLTVQVEIADQLERVLKLMEPD